MSERAWIVEWQQLAYFRVVGRTQNVTRAAQQLGVTQPALSRALGRLERELGVELFERVGRNIRLTRHGDAFLPYVERALRDVEDGRRHLADLSGVEHGTIALGFLHTLGAELVPGLVRGFQARHPGVRFDFNQNASAQLVRQVLAGELDLSLTSGPVTEPGLTWTPLGDEEVILIVPRGHRLAKRRAVRLRATADEAFVSYKPGTAIRELSDGLCRQAGFAPRVTFEGEESGTVAGFVAAGLGIAIVPAVIPPARGIVRLHVTEPVARRSIGVIRSTDRYFSRAAQAFLDYVVATGL